jgi:hypothetical protein
MAAPTTLRIVDPEQPQEQLPPATFDLDAGDHGITVDADGVARIEHGDGSVTFDENPDLNQAETDEDDFYRNLANDIGDEELGRIASELLTGIELDDQSRSDWLQARASFIRLLGLKLEEPRGDTTSAPLEGMSTIRHPLMLEATIHFQANALGELLPATGPVKVRNDLPMRPDAPIAARRSAAGCSGPRRRSGRPADARAQPGHSAATRAAADRRQWRTPACARRPVHGRPRLGARKGHEPLSDGNSDRIRP